jgi:hypothetical protein
MITGLGFSARHGLVGFSPQLMDFSARNPLDSAFVII